MRHLFHYLLAPALITAGLLAAQPVTAQHALRFTSADEDRVTLTSTRLGTGSFTYEAWVNYSAPAFLGGYNTLFELGNDLRAVFVLNDGRIEMYGGSTSIDSNGPLATQGWHHVACTYNDVTTQCVIYIDGIVAGSGQASFPNTTTDALGIGDHSNDDGWQGEIDEVIIWNSPRTITQVQADKAGLVTGNEPELIAYYKFDAGSGQTLVNRKVGGPTAVLGESTAVETMDPQWTNSNILAAPAALPAAGLQLTGAYPNPASGVVTVPFVLPNGGRATLEVLDNLGRSVATLLRDEVRAAGPQSVRFDASALPAGLYTCRLLTAGAPAATQRLVLVH